MLCRLCLDECDLETAMALFLNNGDETNVSKLIAKYARIEITLNDTISTMICYGCNKHLEDFHEFLEKVEQRQIALQKEFMAVECVFQEGTPTAAAVALTNNADFEHNEESLLDIKDVIVDHETHFEFGQALEDSELEQSFDGNDAENDFEDNENEVCDDDDDLPLNKLATKSVPKKNSKSTKRVGRLVNKKVCKKRRKTLRTKTGAKISKENIDINETASKNYKAKISYFDKEKYKIQNKERDELINKHMKMKCELCEAGVKTFRDLKIHFREIHKQKAYVVCCSQRFFKRFQLVDHIQVHLNPNHFQCKICSKVLSSRACMDVHNANTHAEKSILKHPCTMCDRRFAHMSNLQAHLLSHSQERKFTCDICSKGFKSPYMLKMHKQKMHEQRQFYICDICGKEYRFKPSFIRHVDEHKTGAMGPTEECPICGKLLMPNGLRRHLDRHNVQEIECTICGKKLKSKAALKGHIDYAHKKTRSYECTFCDKSFKRPCVLKEHIAMHTGQKLYNCPNCPREFRSKANMYAHKKKAHRAEWEQAQIQVAGLPKIEQTEKTSNQIEIVADVPC